MARFKKQRRGWLTARVEQAIADCGSSFSLSTVLAAYRARFGVSSRPRREIIATTLWKVVRKRGYQVVRRGTGRAQSLYSR